jgi:hypothetical protein
LAQDNLDQPGILSSLSRELQRLGTWLNHIEAYNAILGLRHDFLGDHNNIAILKTQAFSLSDGKNLGRKVHAWLNERHAVESNDRDFLHDASHAFRYAPPALAACPTIHALIHR